MDQSELYGKIYEVMTNQQFGVIATAKDDTPHASIVAFTVTNNLRTVLFLTKQGSRKFKNIGENPNVTFLVDVRPESSRSISDAFSITAFGTAHPVDLSSAHATRELFTFCHPSLNDFLDDPAYTLMSISIQKYNVNEGLDGVYTYKIGS